jgi:hypothetical protein
MLADNLLYQKEHVMEFSPWKLSVAPMMDRTEK